MRISSWLQLAACTTISTLIFSYGFTHIPLAPTPFSAEPAPTLSRGITLEPASAVATTSGGRVRGGSFGSDDAEEDSSPPPSSGSSTSSPSPSGSSSGSSGSSGSPFRSDSDSNRSSGSNSGSNSNPGSSRDSFSPFNDDDSSDSSDFNSSPFGSDRDPFDSNINDSNTDSNNNSGSSRSAPPSPLIGVIFFVGCVVFLGVVAIMGMKQLVQDLTPVLSPKVNQGWKTLNKSWNSFKTRWSEVENNRVTITQVQIAMLAEARGVQRDLNKMAASANLTSQAGLVKVLQETALAILRSPQNWTHASAQSETVSSRSQAKQKFEWLSMAERSKFDVESLTNVEGEVTQRDLIERDEDPAAYIVVTLIVGSAHDKPLIREPIRSPDELRSLLMELGAITADYLMVCEVLWSPQNESDSLTREELVLHYPDLVQIA